MPSKRLPRYMPLVMQHAEANPQLITPGGISHVEVRHDDWCRLLRYGKDCNCNPVIVSGPSINAKYEGKR
jgi:hypothetical protein